MGFTKKCECCGQIKELRGGFKYTRATKQYSPICKECQAKDINSKSGSWQKSEHKRHLKRSWEKLCPLMNQAEVDQMIYNLKIIYEDSKNNS